MKIFNNKTLTFFSFGLNIGLIIFIVFNLAFKPVHGVDRALKTAEEALDEINADKDTRDLVIKEINDFHEKIGPVFKGIYKRRLEILKEYSRKDKDVQKIRHLEEEFTKYMAKKDNIFSDHLVRVDKILKDKSDIYFSFVYKDVKKFFGRKHKGLLEKEN